MWTQPKSVLTQSTRCSRRAKRHSGGWLTFLAETAMCLVLAVIFAMIFLEGIDRQIEIDERASVERVTK